MNNTTFGNTLNKLKTDRGLTSRELAYNAGIGEGLISGLIHDQRVIGESTARKLGNALHLTGAEFEDFVYAAINNCSEKTLEYPKQYPAELINLVVGGILPSEIKRCIRKDEDADAALYLNDGTEALIKLELAFT
jgi:transcriptional regulator with XRE-family HTH domain